MDANAHPPKKVSDLFPSRFLTATDLNGKTYNLVVERVAIEKLRDKFTNNEEYKCVLYFTGAKKGLALNKTQALAMVEITGLEEFERWPGAQVQLSPGFARGKQTIVIRAQAPTSLSPKE